MNKRFAVLCVIALFAALFCIADYNSAEKDGNRSGSPSPVAVTPNPSSAPTPVPTATPLPTPETVVSYAADGDSIAELFYELLYADVLTLENTDSYLLEANKEQTFNNVLKNKETYMALAGQLKQDLLSRCEGCAESLQDTFSDTTFFYTVQSGDVDWKYIGSLLWLLPGEISFSDFYDVTLTVDSVESGSDCGQYVSFTVQISKKSYYDLLLALDNGNRDYFMASDFIMAYLTTVYDEEGNETDYVMPELSEEYIETIHKPLDGNPVFYDRWYQGRSGNSRKHTGLDLHARRNANIYSCTDGTVLYIGYRNTPGYYVVIRDSYGYIYHYYHMNKLSSFLTEGQTVSAGDLIGYVGNTGNSDLNHLHLGLVTPDCEYVRLYDIMNTLYGK